jgi:hypothetical protein
MAQPAIDSLDAKYGLDPILFNGKRYSYYPSAETGGSQYLNGDEFQKGSLVVRGINYPGRLLNYDAYNQQLILRYKTDLSASEQLIVSDAWLSSFTIGSQKFALIPLTDTTRRICQVIDTLGYRVAYAWRKDLILDTNYGATNHVFAKPVKESFIRMNGEYLRFRNNKSFVRSFEKAAQPMIKKHLRKSRLNVKKISDKDMLDLLAFCATIWKQ